MESRDLAQAGAASTSPTLYELTTRLRFSATVGEEPEVEVALV